MEMKPTKPTLIYLIAMATTILFDLAFASVTTYVLVGKLKGLFFVPDWFFPFCIAAAVVNGVFFIGTIVYYSLKRR